MNCRLEIYRTYDTSGQGRDVGIARIVIGRLTVGPLRVGVLWMIPMGTFR